jgi:ferredoxin
MRGRFLLRKERLGEALRSFQAKGYAVFLPYLEGETVLFLPYDGRREPFLEWPSTLPPKSILFPQSETLFYFHRTKKDGKVRVELEEVAPSQQILIFGSRPCDAKGFSTFDKVFVGDHPKDPYYMERRLKTTIFSLTCPFPTPSCFCLSVGLEPDGKEGSDIIATQIDEGLYVEILTEKGERLMEGINLEDGASFEGEVQMRIERTKSLIRRPFDPKDRIQVGIFEQEEFWKEAVSKCISCGLCTYLCPTCYCFNITDEAALDRGERIRSWDSCMFYHYTLEASGHNPRPTKFDRFKNRVGHKFLFFPERYEGSISCTGCGRCVRFCPVSVDIAEIVRRLKEAR